MLQLQETNDKLLEREQKLMELEQLAKRKEIEIADLKQSNKSQSTVISTKEEHIAELELDVKNRKEYVYFNRILLSLLFYSDRFVIKANFHLQGANRPTASTQESRGLFGRTKTKQQQTGTKYCL